MRSMFFDGVRIFNKLPTEIKEMELLRQFREGVERWLMDVDIKCL